MIKPTRLSGEVGPGDGRKYYHNSIEHLVKQQKATRHRGRRYLLQNHRYNVIDQDTDWEPELSGSMLESMLDLFNLRQVKFEMWVSPPDDPEHALHKYTELQTATESRLSMPLENIIDWRVSFPHLQNSMKEWSAHTSGEIVLLDVSFRLMDNFPPPHSKLGIGFELEFGSDDNTLWNSGTKELKNCNWHSVTFLYQNGEQIREPMGEQCIVSNHGQVRPIFQSRWWASTFTSLTETKRLAEDSKDPAAIMIANERVRGFFQSLTIMQEIWATPVSELSEDENRLAKRMTILLWKFSEAPDGFSGTTLWQKLTAPPERFAMNSPLPPGSEINMPPLVMDAMVQAESTRDIFVDDDIFLGVPDDYRSTSLHHPRIEDDIEIGPEGYVSFKTGIDRPVADFSNPIGIESNFDHLHAPSNTYPFELQGKTDVGSHNCNNERIEANIFEMPGLTKHGTDPSNTSHVLLDHMARSPNSPLIAHGSPLARFDRKYHKVLQEQLGVEEAHPNDHPNSQSSPKSSKQSPLVKSEMDESGNIQAAINLAPNHHEPWTEVDDQDQGLRSALLAASAADAVGPTRLSENPQPPREDQYMMSQSSQTPHWCSPLTFRPTLQTHHSFPGLDYHSGGHDGFVLLDQPQDMVPSEPSLQPDLVAEARYFEMDTQATQACVSTFVRPQSEPYMALYEGNEGHPYHAVSHGESSNQESGFQDGSLTNLQLPDLFSDHASDSQSRDISLVPHDMTPVFGAVVRDEHDYAEVQMQDIEI